jgi:hypothetical protein
MEITGEIADVLKFYVYVEGRIDRTKLAGARPALADCCG